MFIPLNTVNIQSWKQMHPKHNLCFVNTLQNFHVVDEPYISQLKAANLWPEKPLSFRKTQRTH